MKIQRKKRKCQKVFPYNTQYLPDMLCKGEYPVYSPKNHTESDVLYVLGMEFGDMRYPYYISRKQRIRMLEQYKNRYLLKNDSVMVSEIQTLIDNYQKEIDDGLDHGYRYTPLFIKYVRPLLDPNPIPIPSYPKQDILRNVNAIMEEYYEKDIHL